VGRQVQSARTHSVVVAGGSDRGKFPPVRLLSGCLALLLSLASVAEAQLREIRVSASPTLVIGNNDNDDATTFAGIDGTTRLPDGRIVVGDRGPYSIRVFSAEGKLLTKLGRKGSGPGEIWYLARFYRCGDELFAYDIENGYRRTVFSLDLAYKREFRFGGPTGGPPNASACTSQKRFIQLGWESRKAMKAGAFRSDVDFWFSRADDKVELKIGMFPGSERWGLVNNKQFSGTRPLPFGKQPVVAIASNRAYIGTADKFEIMVFDLSGKRIGLLQDNVPLRPVTKSDIDGPCSPLMGSCWRGCCCPPT